MSTQLKDKWLRLSTHMMILACIFSIALLFGVIYNKPGFSFAMAGMLMIVLAVIVIGDKKAGIFDKDSLEDLDDNLDE